MSGRIIGTSPQGHPIVEAYHCGYLESCLHDLSPQGVPHAEAAREYAERTGRPVPDWVLRGEARAPRPAPEPEMALAAGAPLVAEATVVLPESVTMAEQPVSVGAGAIS
jgi:hypothetical protein